MARAGTSVLNAVISLIRPRRPSPRAGRVCSSRVGDGLGVSGCCASAGRQQQRASPAGQMSIATASSLVMAAVELRWVLGVMTSSLAFYREARAYLTSNVAVASVVSLIAASSASRVSGAGRVPAGVLASAERA